MAEIRIEKDNLVVELSLAEKAESIHGDLTIPLPAITKVEILDNPFSHLRGIRVIGTSIPKVVAVGTWVGVGHKSFVALHGHQNALQISLDEQSYDELIIGTDDPEATSLIISQARKEKR